MLAFHGSFYIVSEMQENREFFIPHLYLTPPMMVW